MLQRLKLKSQLSEFHNPLTCHAREEKQVVVQYSLSDYRVLSQPSNAQVS
jgi:hypothetical protein